MMVMNPLIIMLMENEDAHIIGKNVGEKLLSLAGTKFKKMNILITRPLIDQKI